MSVAAKKSLIREFVSKYRGRIVRGLAVYGEFNAKTDDRILSIEAQEEILDGCGSYMEMLEEKRPDLQPEIQKIRAKGILLYGELRELEKLERTPAREGDL